MNGPMKEKRAELLFELDALWNVCQSCDYNSEISLDHCKQCKVFTAISSYEGDLICLTGPRKHIKTGMPAPLTFEKIRKMYEQGMALEKISLELYIHPITLRKHVNKWKEEGLWKERDRYEPTFEEVRALYEQGQTYDEIAKTLSQVHNTKISRNVLSGIIQKWGKQGKWKKREHPEMITPERVRELKAAGMTYIQISEMLGKHRLYVGSLVHKWRKKGIEI